MGAISNRLISGTWAAWYAATEPVRLRWARQKHGGDYDGLNDPRFHAPQKNADGSFTIYGSSDPPINPLVTVYIPTHNRVDLLMERALPSVLAQTYRNIEIIVAAHGCTDGTASRVCGLGRPKTCVLGVPRRRTYPPTVENHWFAKEVAPANAALRAAGGAWIARLDDDDIWTPDHVEKLLRFAQKGDFEFVSAAYERERDGVREVVPHFGSDIIEAPYIGGHQTWLYRSYLRFMRYNQECWRKRWNRVNDTDLADRFWKAGVRIGWLDEVLAYVIPRPGETTVGLEAYRRNAVNIERELAF
ncbi:MAG TPA: glycosyltransferase [Aurantimonas coralicida]|uniref:Glycosyltransferase n=2 Tax=root TaxID=1 RepID=A0A9C9NEE0_9HYPH|nr:glycosyltransferase [Aurantimonas coralicida]HET99667.1 glycosyltransferase [Aurantimonas coralicida]